MPVSRTQTGRDAVTVEIVYATVTGALFGIAGFLAAAAPALLGATHGPARREWLAGSAGLAATLFCGWVAHTLVRFERRNRQEGDGRTALDQPSQPGLTNPDS